jgi:hypothetical protein
MRLTLFLFGCPFFCFLLLTLHRLSRSRHKTHFLLVHPDIPTRRIPIQMHIMANLNKYKFVHMAHLSIRH